MQPQSIRVRVPNPPPPPPLSLWTLYSLRVDHCFLASDRAKNLFASTLSWLFVPSTASWYLFSASAYCSFVASPPLNIVLIFSNEFSCPIFAEISQCFTAWSWFPFFISKQPRLYLDETCPCMAAL